jgi:hypothetical protein
MIKKVIDGFAYMLYPNHVAIVGYEPTIINGCNKHVIPTLVDNKPVTKIDTHALAFSKLERIELPASITSIGNKAFFKSEVKEVVFYASPDYTCQFRLEVEASAFKECVNLTLFDTQQFVTAGYLSFSYCPNLTHFGQHRNMQFECIHPDAFAYSGVEEIHLSNKGWLQANALNNSSVKKIWIKDAAKIPKKTLNYIKKKEIVMITNQYSPLMDLVYDGFLVEESQIVY